MLHFGTLDPPSPVLLPFLLDEKGRKNQGRHHGPTARSGRPSPMSAMASAPNPDDVWRIQSDVFDLPSKEFLYAALLPAIGIKYKTGTI